MALRPELSGGYTKPRPESKDVIIRIVRRIEALERAIAELHRQRNSPEKTLPDP